MTNKKSTKRALLMSLLAMLLCVTMLVGTTFAWFTDSVTSSGNIIKSGTLKIGMYWAKGTEDPATTQAWTDAAAGAIFNHDNWEPGYVEARHIKIANEGSLALKYQVKIAAEGEVTDLTDVIDVYYADPAVVATRGLDGMTRLGTLTEVLAGMGESANGVLLAKGVDTITLALKMQEEAGNEYQGKSIGSSFAIQLVATQYTFETDSFDDQYDVDAVYPVVDNAQLDAALEEINDPNSGVDSAVIALSSGAYNTNFSVAGGKDVVIQGDGASTVLNGQIATTSSTEGVITLRNLTVNVSDAIKDSTGISQTSKSAIAIWGNQTVICENVTFNMDLANSTAITSWWDTGVGTSIIVRDCTFNCNGQRPIRATGNVTVENCTFNDPYRYAVQLTAKASTATLLDKATVNFNNNKIVNGENGKEFVYGIQLEGADYGCNNLVINGSGNTIENGGTASTMYYCECGKVDHDTIEWNVECTPVHEN